jgi:hypothetical protein
MQILLDYWKRLFCSTSQEISDAQILKAQDEWGKWIVWIGDIEKTGGNYLAAADTMLDELYVKPLDILFKPTKASDVPFRKTRGEILSYFVGGTVLEDTGFALTPWESVTWENHGFLKNANRALAMGHYTFKNATTEITVEYTFGYVRSDKDGSVKINLHHSSIPYKPASAKLNKADSMVDTVASYFS